MSYLAVGVLGHVDHGKTSLVRALTGVDTDRLKEEKERGISIVLGFADRVLPEGRIAFIDAPGHERFVREMVAGATGIRAALLVVSAAEGVKPQTIEHLDIAELLGVEAGAIALSQCDRADAPTIARAEAEIGALVKNSFLRDAPLIRTSAVTQQGIDELLVAVTRLLAQCAPIPDEGPAYLPVDRVFSLAGAGTVVTGTLRRGSLAEGEELEIYPRETRAAVRQVQSHAERTARAVPGRRTAVNLRGLQKDAIARGDALAPPGTLQRARFVDVKVNASHRAQGAIAHGQRVRVLFGTSEALARIHLFGPDNVASGDSQFAQLQFESPAVLLVKERFVLRSYSPVRTLGGGVFLGVSASRRRRDADTGSLVILSRGKVDEVLAMRCRECAPVPVDARTFAIAERFSEVAVLTAAQAGELLRVGEWGVALRANVEDGPKGAAPELDERLYALANEIAAPFRDGGFEPPALTDVVGRDKDRNRAYRFLVDTGVLVVLYVPNKPRTLTNTVVFHSDAVVRAEELLRAQFGASGDFDTGQAKALLNISRKYLIPLLEHLDTRGFTRRGGERRTICAGPA